MIFSTLVSLSALPALAYAQYGSGGGGTPPTTAAPSAPSAPADTNGQMNIDVAPNGQFAFSPPNIDAPVGTLVTFWFPSTNNGPHSVTQSSFADPCTFLEANSSANTGAGFDSGLQSATTFTINITDTQPIWFHCKQVGHCGMGMVGSINAPTDGANTFDNFMSAAKAIGAGETLEQDNGPVMSGVHATVVASPAPVGATGGSPAPVGATGGSSTPTNGATPARTPASPSGAAVSSPSTTAGSNGASALAPSSFIAVLFAGAIAFVL